MRWLHYRWFGNSWRAHDGRFGRVHDRRFGDVGWFGGDRRMHDGRFGNSWRAHNGRFGSVGWLNYGRFGDVGWFGDDRRMHDGRFGCVSWWFYNRRLCRGTRWLYLWWKFVGWFEFWWFGRRGWVWTIWTCYRNLQYPQVE